MDDKSAFAINYASRLILRKVKLTQNTVQVATCSRIGKVPYVYANQVRGLRSVARVETLSFAFESVGLQLCESCICY